VNLWGPGGLFGPKEGREEREGYGLGRLGLPGKENREQASLERATGWKRLLTKEKEGDGRAGPAARKK